MKQEKLTEEQDKKLKELRNKYIKKGMVSGLKFGALTFLANLFVAVIDVLFVGSQTFAFVGMFVSFFIIFRSFRLSLSNDHDRLREEVKKILEE